MTIETHRDGDTLTVVLEGRMDATGTRQVEQKLMSLLEDGTHLMVDFAKVDYMSSAGLRALHSMQKVVSRKGGMKLLHVHGPVRDVFQMTGFDRILHLD